MNLTRLRYLASFPLLPVMALQGRRVRAVTPVLPEAGGERTGHVPGEGEPLQVLILGESTAAGCGVERQEQGMGGQLAASLARRTGRAVDWTVVGRNGVTAKVTRQQLLPLVPLQRFDLAAVILGVNDTKNLTAARQWQVDLTQLFFDLRVRIGPAPLLASGVPPMGLFPALPPPLRGFLNLRASLMDDALITVLSQTPRSVYGGPLVGLTPEMFSRDRFHPGASGYAAWADGLGRIAVEAFFSD